MATATTSPRTMKHILRLAKDLPRNDPREERLLLSLYEVIDCLAAIDEGQEECKYDVVEWAMGMQFSIGLFVSSLECELVPFAGMRRL